MQKPFAFQFRRAFLSTLFAIALIGTLSRAEAGTAPATEVITGKTDISVDVGETTDRVMIIGGAEVRITLVDGVAYIAVAKGTLTMNYADGTPMTSLKAGGVMSLSGFLGGGSGVSVSIVDGKPTLTLAPALNLKMAINKGAGDMQINSPGGGKNPITLKAPKKAGQIKTVKVNAPFVTVPAGGVVPTLNEGQVAKFENSSMVAFKSNEKTYLTGGTFTDGGNQFHASKANGKFVIDGGTITNGHPVMLTGGTATSAGGKSYTLLSGSRHRTIAGGSKIVARRTLLRNPEYRPGVIFGSLEKWDGVGADRRNLSLVP